MKLINPEHAPPSDAQKRKSEKPVVCYPINSLPDNNLEALKAVKKTITLRPIKPTAAILNAKARTKNISTIDSINNSALSV